MGLIETLHIKTLICTRIPIPKERLAVFTNYPSVTKDQALEETVLTLFHPVIHGCFQPIGVTIGTSEDCQSHLGTDSLQLGNFMNLRPNENLNTLATTSSKTL